MSAPPDPLHGLSVLLQLQRRARQAEDSSALGFVIVNESRQLLDYRQAMLWSHDALTAVSGLPEPERNTPYSLWLARLMRFYQQHPSRMLSPAQLPQDLAQDWMQWLPEQLLILPLKLHIPTCTYWLLARDEPWRDEEIALAQELADSYAHAWRIFLPQHSYWQQLKHSANSGKYRKRLALALLLLSLLPVQLTVLAPAEVTAKDAFLVRAPLEGVVDQILVRPNMPVKTGQALFELDTSGLRMRIDVARQAYAAATEEYRQSAQLVVSDDSKSKLELSQRKARMEEKAAELSYSEQLLDRVQVKAARDGIAVFNDPHDWIGKSVAIGERVMQIADPNKREMVIRLPVNDAITLANDAEVTLYLSSSPQYAYDAKLSFIAYRAELGADGLMSYKLKADFLHEQTLPRLGLTGTAKLHGERVPLIYYILRRPLTALRQYVGW